MIVHLDSAYVPFEKGSKKYKFLARMVQKEGKMKEVDLEKDGNWGPKCVYCIKHMSEIGSVESQLEGQFQWKLRV